MSRLLLIFLKFPVPGRVKTRLAAETGPEEAAQIYRKLVQSVFQSAGRSEGTSLRVDFDPPSKAAEIEEWIRGLGLTDCRFRAQAEGDLGDRLISAFTAGFDEGHDQIAVIGTDSPEISTQHISTAWQAMDDGADLVFGPALDGGFYLFAASCREHVAALEGIRWSQPDTLEQCMAKANARSWSVSLLEPLRDIDTLADWNAYLANK
ncbi:MAG: TIGR04282 family arsenosugar biosynthesis glycosyltransferase [Verrucomicrobiota bacterium]